MSEPATVEQLLRIGERVLSDSTHIFEDHDTDAEAKELLAFCLEVDEDDLDEDEELPVRQRERFLSLIARRAAGEPFPILVGRIEFYGLDLKVRAGAFVPRPSSELTVERALRRLKRRQDPVVVDVCSGAGPIAMAIAVEVPRADVWGTDIDANGLTQARENARDLDIDNVTFKRGDMYDALPARLESSVDVITGHVPYVPLEEIEDLPSEVREHEPAFMLSDQTEDGLFLMHKAVFEAPRWLKPGGWLLLEVSEDFGSKIRRLCRQAGLDDHGAAMDEDRLSVVVEARKPDGGAPRPPKNRRSGKRSR
ncbi:MAG: N5-glutamine methyltransferase family protein [Actinomycetota bacterium]